MYFPLKIADITDNLGRTPRFLQQRITEIFDQVDSGMDIILKTYLTQYIDNWRTNYDYVFRNFFSKIFEATKLKKPK